jgi:hypothetical protein
MPDMIKDGTGAGFLAEVTAQNRLSVTAVTETENKDINERTGGSYLLYIDITPTGALDNCLYMKNTSADNMFINWYRVWSGTNADAIDIYRNMVGTPAGTTIVTPVNMNFGSNDSATGDFYEGVDITGLSGGNLLDRLRLSGDGKDVVDGYPGDIIVPRGSNISFQAVTGTFPLEITISFYYKAAT